jgi:hypothetical protein
MSPSPSTRQTATPRARSRPRPRRTRGRVRSSYPSGCPNDTTGRPDPGVSPGARGALQEREGSGCREDGAPPGGAVLPKPSAATESDRCPGADAVPGREPDTPTGREAGRGGTPEGAAEPGVEDGRVPGLGGTPEGAAGPGPEGWQGLDPGGEPAGAVGPAAENGRVPGLGGAPEDVVGPGVEDGRGGVAGGVGRPRGVSGVTGTGRRRKVVSKDVSGGVPLRRGGVAGVSWPGAGGVSGKRAEALGGGGVEGAGSPEDGARRRGKRGGVSREVSRAGSPVSPRRGEPAPLAGTVRAPGVRPGSSRSVASGSVFGGVVGRGGAVGRGGMEACRASVLMRPPFPLCPGPSWCPVRTGPPGHAYPHGRTGIP